ncbi:MAG: hypothetical protein LQ351_005698 [Letrouitia transgressa]|nr:MAG: hypothetical protein LQ351_005698 [Letrouitia transgressa]
MHQKLESVQTGLQAEPENEELKKLKLELEEIINFTNTSIAELKPAAPIAPKKSSSPPPKEKWSKENHPAYQAGYRKPTPTQGTSEEAPSKTTFAVNDNVFARWLSGDNKFYPARITSITGSSSKPVYIVTFKNYSSNETISNTQDIRSTPSDNPKKRKVDGTPATPATPSTPANASVISAAATINPDLAHQAKREPSKVSDGPPRPVKMPRKVKANKELEAGKNKWQNFTTKAKLGKVPKKESMFRTPEGINARVGFTGSGQEMRKDPSRSRHIYQQGEEEEGT